MTELNDRERAELIRQTSANIAVMTVRSAWLSRAQVAMMLGYSYAGVARLLEDPTFPPAVRMRESGTRRWKSGDIQDWAQAHMKSQLAS